MCAIYSLFPSLSTPKSAQTNSTHTRTHVYILWLSDTKHPDIDMPISGPCLCEIGSETEIGNIITCLCSDAETQEQHDNSHKNYISTMC